MKGIGIILILVGVVSIGLNLFGTGIDLKVLTWVDQWGTNIGWAIRGGVLGLGILLWIIGQSTSSSESKA